MTRIKLTDLKAMFGDRNLHNLYHALLPVTKGEPGSDGEVVVIDDAAIKGEAFQKQWKNWVERNPEKVLSSEQPHDELWEVQQRDAQVQKGSDEAIKRYIDYWIGERKLVNCSTNKESVLYEIERIQAKEPQIISAKLIDRAVGAANLAGTLIWYVAEIPTRPPAVVETPPPLDYIPGTTELRLPLGTQPSSRHTVVQLRDLDARTRAEHARKVRENNNAVAAANKPAVLEVV